MSSFLLRLFSQAKPRTRTAKQEPYEVRIEARPPSLLATLKELWQGREICLKLIRKDLTVQYKQTLIGILWFVFRPVAVVAIFATIFSYIIRFPAGDTPYAVFVMCGIVPWLYFSDAFQRGINSLQGNAHIVTRIYFPRVILPISVITAPLADFVVGMLALFVLMLLYGLTPPPQIVFLPFFLLLIYLFVLAMSLCLAAPQAIFRDVAVIFGFLLTLWMYLTPVLYPLSILPPLLQKILVYNPMTGIVLGLRWSVLGYGELQVQALLVSVAATAGLLVLGTNLFHRFESRYIDQI